MLHCEWYDAILNVLGSDAKKCTSEFQSAWCEFGDAFKSLSGHRNIFSGFDNSTHNITRGVNDMGLGLQQIAQGVSDCHMGDLVAILQPLAAKLVGVPEIAWVEAFLKILIDGVPIEKELAGACTDYARKDWPGFGSNLVALTKTLLKAPVTANAIYV